MVTLFGTLRFVISRAMGTDRHEVRPLLQGYAFDLRMATQVGMLFVLSFGVTFAVNTLQVQTTAWGMDAGLDPEALRRGWGFILRMTTLLVPWAISLAMFTQLFYFIPRPKPPLRSAAVGAAVTAVLFEGAKNGFTLYARYSGRFFRYDATEGANALDSLQGVFLLILVFVVWAYISAFILVVGAMVASLHEQRHQPRRSAIRRLWRTIRQRRRSGEAGSETSEASQTSPASVLEDGSLTSATPALASGTSTA
ncbi:MAG: YihY/virulence factor BrkB family protein [Bacteroidetes bacterium]|nr:YihY/virulence factor BrkB family protein [Bacteroidota bacterium]